MIKFSWLLRNISSLKINIPENLTLLQNIEKIWKSIQKTSYAKFGG